MFVLYNFFEALEKEENKHQASRRKEITKFRVERNEIGTKRSSRKELGQSG